MPLNMHLHEFIFHEVKSNSNFVAWFRIKKCVFRLSEDLLLGVVYIPPASSEYSSDEAFEESQTELLDLLHLFARVVILIKEREMLIVTAVLAGIVFLVYLYSYNEFCFILYSYLIILGELYLLHCLVRVVIARWRFALPYYS